jgi:hypothetical protein
MAFSLMEERQMQEAAVIAHGSAESGTNTSLALSTPQGQAQFTFFRNEMVETIRVVSSIAERGAGNLLLGLGTAMILLGLFLKLAPGGLKLSTLAPSEFITVILAALLILAGGAGLKLHVYRLELTISGRIQEAGVDLIKAMGTMGAEIVHKQPKPTPP